jgi:hypothetical protein
MLVSEEWEKKPKPNPGAAEPNDPEYLLKKLAAMYDLAHLAFATDSTRLITLMIKLDGFSERIPGVGMEAHNLSHHVGRPEAIEQLQNLELAEFKELAKLLGKLAATKEDGQTLLDRTVVFYGSNLGNGNNHDTKNLPVFLAGGGFKHGQHLAAAEPLREHPPAARHRGRSVRHEHRHAHRPDLKRGRSSFPAPQPESRAVLGLQILLDQGQTARRRPVLVEKHLGQPAGEAWAT